MEIGMISIPNKDTKECFYQQSLCWSDYKMIISWPFYDFDSLFSSCNRTWLEYK